MSQALGFVVDPFFILFLLISYCLLKAILSKSTKRPLAYVMVYFFIVGFTPISSILTNYLEGKYPVKRVGRNDFSAAVDYAVVLGGEMISYNQANNQYRMSGAIDRLVEAIRLARWGYVRTLIFTGASSDAKPTDIENEANSMAKYAAESGLRTEQIIIEPFAKTTYENAINVAKILKRQNVNSFILVTSAMHMWRAKQVFEKLGFKPIPYATDYRGSTNKKGPFKFWDPSRWHLLKQATHELLGLAYYKILGYI